MARPTVYETNYAHDQRLHQHRCQCCRKVVNAGERVLQWKIDAKTSRVLHIECAGRPSFDGLTQRELAALHSNEYAKALGYR